MTTKKLTKSEWLKVNGFSKDGETYIVMGNSYKIKDNLKEAGFKFSPLLRWHTDNDKYDLPDGCHYCILEYNQIFIWDEEKGVTFMQEGARDFLEDLFNPPRESKSEYQGEIGEYLTCPHCEVSNISGYSGPYGYTWIYTFRDIKDNEYTWFTTVNKSLAVGMHCYVFGTVKAHNEYKGVKTTVLTRCGITVEDD